MPLLTANGIIPDMGWAHFESSGQDGKAKTSGFRHPGKRGAMRDSSLFPLLPFASPQAATSAMLISSLSVCLPVPGVRERPKRTPG